MARSVEDVIAIDGSAGEGGGQILRTSLALSLVTGRPFRVDRIRAARRKPGLLRQHLTAVQAAAAIGGARVRGADLGSEALLFEPGPIRAGEYRFAVGTAGSATLVLQTVLPALLRAPQPSRVTVEGGTHNPAAPPFDFIAEAFLPLLRRMGGSVTAQLDSYGFYPAGGGRVIVGVEPCRAFQPLVMLERGPVEIRARAVLSGLPDRIATRELAVARGRLGLARERCAIQTVERAGGLGNVLMIDVRSDAATEVMTGFGEKGVTSEAVAARACDEVAEYLDAGVPVGRHLADQLLIPLAMGRGGAFRTLTPTPHTTTNAAVIGRFLDVAVDIDHESERVSRITVKASS